MMSALFWFEIPVSDFERARKFYETVMNVNLPSGTTSIGNTIAQFPDRGGVGGALVYDVKREHLPGKNGTVVYLVVDGDYKQMLERVCSAGGELIADWGEGHGGYSALVSDTEGNHVGFFTPQQSHS
jgi:uncharacterized protein